MRKPVCWIEEPFVAARGRHGAVLEGDHVRQHGVGGRIAHAHHPGAPGLLEAPGADVTAGVDQESAYLVAPEHVGHAIYDVALGDAIERHAHAAAGKPNPPTLDRQGPGGRVRWRASFKVVRAESGSWRLKISTSRSSSANAAAMATSPWAEEDEIAVTETSVPRAGRVPTTSRASRSTRTCSNVRPGAVTSWNPRFRRRDRGSAGLTHRYTERPSG